MAWQPDYITSAELIAFARTDSADDAEAETIVTTVSRAIDRHCSLGTIRRQFGQVAAPEPRRYTARWSRRYCRWVVEIDDLMTSVGLVVATDAATITEFDLEPANAAAEGRPWTRLLLRRSNSVAVTGERNEILATGRWGWNAFPVAVKMAAKFQGNRWLHRRDSPFGIAGSPQQGSELRLLDRVDPDVAVSLTPYVRKGFVFA